MPKRLGVSVGFPPGPPERADLLARLRVADDLGVDSIWVAEAWGRDAFTLLTELALTTRHARLGTGIVNVFSRSAAVLAMTFGTLDELSGGRMVIGLGSSGANVVEHFHGVPFERALRRLREYVAIIDLLVRGEPLNYEGRIFKLSRGFRLQFTPPRPHIPMYIAAMTPASIRQTGEIADGLMPIHWPRQLYGELRAQLAAGAAAAGRDPRRIEIAPTVSLFITDGDEEEARRRAREPLAFYIGRMGRFYYQLLERNGYAQEVAAVRAAWERRDPAAAVAAVSDRLLEDTGVVGPLDACAEKLDALRALGADVPIIALPAGEPAAVGRVLERLLR
jgi:alkanesulfonate monooxygenase SsuD/methylene tetrahydromethanopterin reductase-like flavin-dependent oxidoreductase (luciferase family)